MSEGDTVQMGAPIAEMEVEGGMPAPKVEQPVASSSPSVQSASRVGSMIIGANVGPTGGEFTDTSLQKEPAVEEEQATVSPGAQSPRRRGRDDRGARISPVVRRLAERHGIDVNVVDGTGAGGRVTRRDVEAYLDSSTAGADEERRDEVVVPTSDSTNDCREYGEELP